jgi:hypothetical protein
MDDAPVLLQEGYVGDDQPLAIHLEDLSGRQGPLGGEELDLFFDLG